MLNFFKSRSKQNLRPASAGRPSSQGKGKMPITEVAPPPAASGQEIELPSELPKVGLEDFDLLKVLGKGGFGKVMLVRKRNTDDIFAMKVLKKEAVIRRNQVEHTKTETTILKQIRHPFLTRMHYGAKTHAIRQRPTPAPPGVAAHHRCACGCAQPSRMRASCTWCSTTCRAGSSSTG